MWATLAVLVFPAPVLAQPVRSRLLVGLDPRQREDGWEVLVRFSAPVRYLQHAPLGRARTARVELSILRSDPRTSGFAGLESMRIPRASAGPVVSVDAEVFEGRRALLDIQFDGLWSFDVVQGEDFRSLSIRFTSARRPEAPGEVPTGPTPDTMDAGEGAPASGSRESVLMKEARKALTAQDYQRATLILREILSLPESGTTRDAMELLGLAHERNGQSTHAAAEYRAFLERYPDGPQAERVRQRLEALLTSTAGPRPSTPRLVLEEPPLQSDHAGSLYVGFRRESRLSDGLEIPVDESLITDFYYRARLRKDRWAFRGEAAGGYRHEFLDSGDRNERINRLFGRLEVEKTGLSATLGRQTRSSGGVLGRFDGLLATYEFLPGAGVSIVGGYPVDSYELELPDFGRYFYGASLDAAGLFGWLDAQVFAIEQRSAGFEDRRAVGAELRFVRGGRFASAYVDYDLLFDELNIAQLVANWSVTPDTFLNLLIDYRNNPILTLTSGLFAQTETHLEQLAERLSIAEIRQLAEDHTARSTMFNVGASHRVTDQLQLSGNFTLSRFSNVPAFAGVEGIGGDGFEYSYYAQVLATNLLRPRDALIGSLRFFDGQQFRAMTGAVDLRWPIARRLRVNPRLQADTRWGSPAGHATILRPSIRADLHWWKLVFDVDSGVEWRTPKQRDGAWGYYVTVGARFDF